MNIIFCSVPYIDTLEPIMAPAVLRAVVEKEGHQACTLDLNAHFKKMIHGYQHCEDLLDNFLFYEGMNLKEECVPFFVNMLNEFTDMIMDKQPDIIALSLLTLNSQVFCRWLSVHLKSRYPDIPIIIGGSGIKNFIANTNNSWAENLRKDGIIDHYIMGDGEISLREFLRGNLQYPGINSNTWTQITDLDSLPFPNFEDYDWNLYESKVMQIVDSRGCVRSCEFCDIIEHWTKYQYRSAESVFEEMVYQIERHGITTFAMRNSLINGNMREFEKLLDLIIIYNEAHTDNPISWWGYFIIRNAKQHPERLWEKLSKTNAQLHLGVESLIRDVRYKLGKKFDNEDIDFHLEMGKKYNVPLLLLIISAYPTETRADLEFTKQWFRDRLHYAGNSVFQVAISYASVLPGTKLEERADEYGIKVGKYPSIWFNQNLAVTAEMKANHIHELNEICKPFQTTKSFKNQTSLDATINVANDYSDSVEDELTLSSDFLLPGAAVLDTAISKFVIPESEEFEKSIT